MSLSALRTREDDLRRQLAGTRAALAEAVATIRATARAEEDLAQLRTGKGGAYRDMSAERAARLEAEIAAGAAATETRARLRRHEAALLEELESTRLDVERAGIRRSALKLLEGIPNGSACPMRWDDMAGDGDARVCPRCKSVVVDVSMLEPDAAEALLATTPSARFHRRSDGTLLARDCVAVQRKRMLAWGCGFLVAATFASCAAAALVDFRLGRRSHSMTPIGDSTALDLHGASEITVDQSFQSVAVDGHDHAELSRTSNGWTYEVTCTGRARTGERHGVLASSVVDEFLRAVEARQPSASAIELACTHTDDYPKYRVEVSTPGATVALTVDNCSRQWHADGRPLANDPGNPPPEERESEHAEINAAYAKLLSAMFVDDCDRDSNGRNGF